MSPTSSTISTTQRPLKSSSRSNPATLCPRTCMTRSSVTTPSAERSLHHCSLSSEKNQRTVDKHYHSFEESLLPSQSLSVCHVRTGRPVHELSSLGFKHQSKPKSRLRKKMSKSRFSFERQKEEILAKVRSEIQKHELSSRVWQKKYPGINWNYWISANGNWSYYFKMWAIQARSITTSRRNIRTKSGSSWNLYQEFARHGRTAENWRVKGRGTFKKKIDWRLWGSYFTLPGLECQDSLLPWRQRREVPRCWDWRRAHQEFAGFTTVLSGARSKCEPVAGLSLAKEKACYKVHSQFEQVLGNPSLGCHKTANLTKS